MRFEGKTCVITGAGSGIGKATAWLFAREGARVVCVDIDQTTGQQTADEINQAGHKALFFPADVSSSEAVQRMARTCEANLSQIDVLFNNAGSTIPRGFEATDEETWSRMIGVNLTGTFLCAKYLLPLMKKARSGAIINHASVGGLLGNPQLTGYCAAKGGVISLTRVMAYEMARYNIRVNCLCTGGIATRLSPPELKQKLVHATPLGRMGEPNEAAYPVLFLASDEASFITGSYLVIDGGRTAMLQGTI